MIRKKSIYSSPFIEVTRTVYGGGVIMTPHHHEETAISFILSGRVQETVHENTGIGSSCNVIIKPSKITHNNIFSNDCTIVSIYLKHQNNLRISLQDLLKEWGWIQGGNIQPLLFKLINSNTENEYYNSLNELLKHLRGQKDKTEFKIIPEWLQDVKLIIDSSYQEVLRTSELAKWVQVHPVYLSRAFQQFFGQSIKSYLKTVRVHNAMATIIDNKDSLTLTAIDTGFSDQSHFNKVFKAETGLTPGEFRRFMQ